MVVFEWPLPTLIAAIYYGLYKPLQSNFPRGDEVMKHFFREANECADVLAKK